MHFIYHDSFLSFSDILDADKTLSDEYGPGTPQQQSICLYTTYIISEPFSPFGSKCNELKQITVTPTDAPAKIKWFQEEVIRLESCLSASHNQLRCTENQLVMAQEDTTQSQAQLAKSQAESNTQKQRLECLEERHRTQWDMIWALRKELDSERDAAIIGFRAEQALDKECAGRKKAERALEKERASKGKAEQALEEERSCRNKIIWDMAEGLRSQRDQLRQELAGWRRLGQTFAQQVPILLEQSVDRVQ